MYKSRRGVDRSKRDSCFFFSPLGSGNLAQIPRWQEGSLPAVGAGVLGNSPQVGNRVRGGDWLMRAHLGVSTHRNSACTYSCLLLQQPVGAAMRQHNPKCSPLPGSQQVALLTLAQSSGQGFLFPGFPPTALKHPCTGPCP